MLWLCLRVQGQKISRQSAYSGPFLEGFFSTRSFCQYGVCLLFFPEWNVSGCTEQHGRILMWSNAIAGFAKMLCS